MIKAEKAVVDNTRYIAVFSLILSVIMQAVFLVAGHWALSVLLGNVLGLIAAVGNFFIMGLTVQSAVGKDEKDARNTMKLSQTLRFLALVVIAVIGYVLPVFDIIAVVIPLLFPRIAIAMYPIFNKNKEDNE